MSYKWSYHRKQEGLVKTTIKAIPLAFAFALAFGLSAQGFSASLPVRAGQYPSLSEKELGHVLWLVKLAQQPLGDWSYMGGLEEGQEGLESYRYQLGYMAYALALAQYHKTPAYRELYQKALDNLIQKMIRKDVWYYWEHTSKGFTAANPPQKGRGLGWIDPVVEKNIMYSGHLINMVELYQMLYGDDKYDMPKSITFRWQLVNQLLNSFQYDGNKLAEVIHKQFIENPLHMIECEIGLVFPVCNQHPLLGLMLYDHNHGTNLAGPVKDLMMKTFMNKGLLDSKTQDFMQFYMIEQEKAIGPASSGNNAFVGMAMHAWKPELIEKLYPTHAKKIEYERDGAAKVQGDETVGASSAPGFAAYAKEMGDMKTAGGLIAWMEGNCSPSWVGNKYYYPRNDEKKITPLFNATAAIAELNVKDGIWTIYNQPWKKDYFAQPFISSVEHPKAAVKQAYYDNSKGVLVVTLAPGEKGVANTSFSVHQLNKAKIYSIKKNGVIIGYLRKGIIEPVQGAKGLEFSKEGVLKISTSLEKAQSFLIQAEA
jgi:hypothetical protein